MWLQGAQAHLVRDTDHIRCDPLAGPAIVDRSLPSGGDAALGERSWQTPLFADRGEVHLTNDVATADRMFSRKADGVRYPQSGTRCPVAKPDPRRGRRSGWSQQTLFALGTWLASRTGLTLRTRLARSAGRPNCTGRTSGACNIRGLPFSTLRTSRPNWPQRTRWTHRASVPGRSRWSCRSCRSCWAGIARQSGRAGRSSVPLAPRRTRRALATLRTRVAWPPSIAGVTFRPLGPCGACRPGCSLSTGDASLSWRTGVTCGPDWSFRSCWPRRSRQTLRPGQALDALGSGRSGGAD